MKEVRELRKGMEVRKGFLGRGNSIKKEKKHDVHESKVPTNDLLICG